VLPVGIGRDQPEECVAGGASAKDYPVSDKARCVLTQGTLILRPMRPVCPEFRPLRPLHPVGPELPGNARSNSMRPEFPRNASSHPCHPGRAASFFVSGWEVAS